MLPRGLQLKLNTDESPNVATEYGIRSIPTVMVFKNGGWVRWARRGTEVWGWGWGLGLARRRLFGLTGLLIVWLLQGVIGLLGLPLQRACPAESVLLPGGRRARYVHAAVADGLSPAAPAACTPLHASPCRPEDGRGDWRRAQGDPGADCGEVP